MERAPDTPHSKYPHVYPIVRVDTPIDQTDPTSRITVVKVLTSQVAAEAEASRLNQINTDKSCMYFYCTSRLIEHGAGGPQDSPWIIRYAEQKDKEEVSIVRASMLPRDQPYRYEENIGLPQTINIVAEENSTVLGFVSVLLSKCNPQGQHLWERLAPYVGFVGVRQEQQHRGVAISLLRFAIEEVAVRCPDEAFMYLEHDIESDLRTFYQRVGFRTMSCDEAFKMAGMYPKSRSDVFRPFVSNISQRGAAAMSRLMSEMGSGC